MEYEFNLSYARRTLISLILLSVILASLLLATENSFSHLVVESQVTFFFVSGIYGLVLILLISRLVFFCRNPFQKIRIDEEILSIPSIYFGNKELYVDDIYSLEEISIKGRLLSIVLGIKGKGRYSIDQYRFASNKDYLNFKEWLESHIEKNNKLENSQSIKNLSIKSGVNIPIFTSSFCLIVFLVFVFLLRNISDEIEMPRQIILGGGTKNIFKTFEFYRLFSSVFLHINGFHLLINIFVLGILSDLLERVISPIRFINVFFLSGLVSYLFFILFSQFEMGVGASGCIYGLWGAYFHLKLYYENLLPGSVNTITFKNLRWVLLSQLVLEIFVLKNTGYVVHIGGFLSGFLFLYLLPLGKKLETVNQPILVEKVLSGIMLLAYSGGLLYFLGLYFEIFRNI